MPIYRSVRAPRKVRYGKGYKLYRVEQAPYRPLILRQRSLRRFKETRPEDYFTLHHKVKRPIMGIDPLEARAVQGIRGTLPERILYKALTDLLHLVPGIDFTFQSSVEGGRLEMGGMLVDFLLPKYRLILQVQGPTHDKFRQTRRDAEQTMILAEMGYEVVELDDDLILDANLLENKLREIFDLAKGYGSPGTTKVKYYEETESRDDPPLYRLIYDACLLLNSRL